MNTQASITSIESRAIQGSVKKAGFSQPRKRARRATGPKRFSMIDLPIIQLTATGESMNGSRNTTRKNRRALISALRSSGEAEGDRVFEEHGDHVVDHVAERVPVERVVPERRRCCRSR